MKKSTVWTKKNVEKMNGEELRNWNNKIVIDLNKAAELKVEMPASEKAFKLIQAEMKKRKMI
jgi:hypothetical protein